MDRDFNFPCPFLFVRMRMSLKREKGSGLEMKLLTEEIRKRLPQLYETEGQEDQIVQVKFFTPDSSWTWYLIEFDGEDLCYGLVDGLCKEFGYFSLKELESITGPLGLQIERDLYFEPTPVSKFLDVKGDLA